MVLTDDEKRMLQGECGEGIQKCMQLLVRWGELFGAERMVKVNNVHMSTNFPKEAIMEMSEGAEGTKTFCTTHAVFDPKDWREKFGIVVSKVAGGFVTTDEKEFTERISLLRKLGFLPTFTCSPYSIGIVPRRGDVMCLTGSAGQAVSNSFFGARAGRESVSTSFAAAMTGKTPLMGLLRRENRHAEVLAQIGEDLDPTTFTEEEYGAIGYHLGGIIGPRPVAINGLPADMTLELERMLVSPLAVSGASVMCHMIGITAEAGSVEEALGGKKPEIIPIGKREVNGALEKLSNAASRDVDMVVLGCPHLTIKEVRELASLINNKGVHQNVKLILGAADSLHTLAKICGYIGIIEGAGGVFINSCISALNPFMFLEKGARVIATNSARAAHYIQRMSAGKTKTHYGGMKKCIQAAVTGKWES